MSTQIPLALRLHHAPSLDDFIVGKNQVVLDQLLRSLQHRGEGLLYISGPPGSGRTHLLLGQCAAAEQKGRRCAYVPLADAESLSPAMFEGLEELDMLAVDDVAAIAGQSDWETGLFALFNRCRDKGTQLLFSATCGPAALPIQLADLRSRLAWGLTMALQPLDDIGRHDLLKSLARRRAMELPDDVARYLLERATRHPRELVDIVARLDHASLAAHRQLTIPFVRTCLGIGSGH
jgi:DnaA family protein